jgi:hypothetical protein
MPGFSASAGFVTFESVVAMYDDSGGVKFNALVRDLPEVDFYRRWIVGGSDA